LLLAIIYYNLDKKAPVLVSAMVEVDPVIVCFPALRQEGTILEHPVELHDGGEAAEGVEAQGLLGVKK
jgi:hypothetical protein